MSEQTCPIWPEEKIEPPEHDGNTDSYIFNSPRAGGKFILSGEAVRDDSLSSEIRKVARKRFDEDDNKVRAGLSRWIYEQNRDGEPPNFTNDNIGEILSSIQLPPALTRVNWLLEYIYEAADQGSGDTISKSLDNPRAKAASQSPTDADFKFLKDMLQSNGFIELDINSGKYLATLAGLEKYESLQSSFIISLLNQRDVTNLNAQGLQSFIADVIAQYLNETKENQLPDEWGFLGGLDKTLQRIIQQTNEETKNRDETITALEKEIKELKQHIAQLEETLQQQAEKDSPLHIFMNNAAESTGKCVGPLAGAGLIYLTGMPTETIAAIAALLWGAKR